MKGEDGKSEVEWRLRKQDVGHNPLSLLSCAHEIDLCMKNEDLRAGDSRETSWVIGWEREVTRNMVKKKKKV